MTVRFTLTGSEHMIGNMQKVQVRFPQYIDEANLIEANRIMKDSKENWVPEDGGDLKESGEVIQVPVGSLVGTGGSAFSGVGHNIVLSYGRVGPTNDYAIPVHEHPSYQSPKVWKGKIISWTKPGTGPKFLERPLKLAQRGMAGRISLIIRTRLNLTPGLKPSVYPL